MASSKRILRVNSLLKEVISEVINKDLNDLELDNKLVSISRVDVTRDLRYATVYISVIGKNDDRDAVLKILSRSASFIAITASKKVVLRYFPTLTFKIDHTVDHQMRIDELIKQVKAKQPLEDNMYE